MKKANVITVLICIFSGIFLTLGFLLLFSALWYTGTFGDNVGFDAILFTLLSDMDGTDTSTINSFLLQGALPTVLCSAAAILLIAFLPRKIKILKEKRNRLCFRMIALTLSAVFLTGSVFLAVDRTKLADYYRRKAEVSSLYEDHYADPEKTPVTFPEKKRNLIYIFLESMEVTFADRENGGGLRENLIPELTRLAEENVNFSHRDGFGGGRTTTGSTWTIAAAVSQSSGIPLCLPDNVLTTGITEDALTLPGMTNLMDILKKNGYRQALMMGSDTDFAGQKQLHQQHGIDEIYDIHTARKEANLPSKNYHDGFWGMEDFHLYEYAKTKLSEMAKNDKPFALTLYTIDTHAPHGNPCELCAGNCDTSLSGQAAKNNAFEEVLSCSSRQLHRFVEWLKTQDFYQNTTVVIVGDHCSMNYAYVSEFTDPAYTRRIYNCILNAPIKPIREKNREFTTLDMFPTTLAALGCTVEGDRLGLGTNLFSDEDTLCEKLGFDTLCSEIEGSSPYYNDRFRSPKK